MVHYINKVLNQRPFRRYVLAAIVLDGRKDWDRSHEN